MPENTLLCAGGYCDPDAIEEDGDDTARPDGDAFALKVVRTRVVEQRVSAFAMGLLSLGTMSGPLLHILGLMLKTMFAGIFLVMGWASIEGNPIIHRTLFCPIIIIIMLVSLRYFVLPGWYTATELAALDDLTTTSEAVLVSLGGALQGKRG